MHRSCVLMLVVAMLVAASGTPAFAVIVSGGGSPTTDCPLVLDIAGANKPALPKTPKAVDCVDGDTSCDADGLRNGQCEFPLQLCVNSSAVDGCTADSVTSIFVDHADDNGFDSRFDTDFQALQARANGLGLPTFAPDRCAPSSTITVKLIGPDASNVMKKNRKSLHVTTDGTVAQGDARDSDKVKFTCRPEGDAVYTPRDFYTGTFDRIRTQIFAQSCALPTCHDSQSQTGGLTLLPDVAYANLVNVTPNNSAANADSLYRVTPGDPSMSLLYLKVTGDLPSGYGARMPYLQAALDPSLVEIIRLWIIGDATLGGAPENGWVAGTDQ